MAVLHGVAVINESTVLTDDEVQAALPVFQHQANYHFRPFWDAGCRLHWVPKGMQPLPGMWQFVILDDSDQAGALGYHDYTPDGLPVAKVFAKTDAKYKLSWTVTFTHELLEALADPDIVNLKQITDTQLYAVEVGDPVEADGFGYDIDGILVTDFVLPAWYHPGVSARRYDYAGHCKQPLEILEGGYQSIYVSGKGWTQVTMRNGRVAHVKVTGQGEQGKRPRRSQEIRRELAA